MKKKPSQSVKLKRSTYRKLVRYAKESCQTVEDTIERIVTDYINEDDELEMKNPNGPLYGLYLERVADLGIKLGPKLVKSVRHNHMEETRTV
jgi:hypothetical protein